MAQPVRESIEMTPKELIKLALDHHPSLKGRPPWRAEDTNFQINHERCVISWVPSPPLREE